MLACLVTKFPGIKILVEVGGCQDGDVLCYATAVHEGNYVLNHTRSGKVTIQQFVPAKCSISWNSFNFPVAIKWP